MQDAVRLVAVDQLARPIETDVGADQATTLSILYGLAM